MTSALDLFLQKAGWRDAVMTRLAADFSSRQFTRLTRAGEPPSAILMQAAEDQKTQEFVAVAALLRSCGCHAPTIYAADAGNGFVLMEDFGDTTFGRLLDEGREAAPLYRRAADALVHLHKRFRPDMMIGLDLPVFDSRAFAAQAELYLDHYLPYAHKRKATAEERAAFREAWLAVLKPLDALPRTLMLRDFMPDNVMNLAGRNGVSSVGLLDFQDAGLGPAVYDIASLCECVRRDASPAILDEMTAYYHAQNPIMPRGDLHGAARVLSAQRHMRILGILARRDDKRGYMERVRRRLDELLNDTALTPIKNYMDKCV